MPSNLVPGATEPKEKKEVPIMGASPSYDVSCELTPYSTGELGFRAEICMVGADRPQTHLVGVPVGDLLFAGTHASCMYRYTQ